MARNSSNFAFKIWDALTDRFSHVDLAENWDKVDIHNHTGGTSGRQIPTAGIVDKAVDATKLADNLKPSTGATDTTEALRQLGTGSGQALPGNTTITRGQLAGDINIALDAIADTLQEGALSATDGQVTVASSTSVHVSAGTAWINGDGVSGVGNGLYRVSWGATDFTIPLYTGPLMKRYGIHVRLTGQHGSTPVVECLDRGTSNSYITSVDVIPGVFRLAEVYANSIGISSSEVIDRRTWARGAYASATAQPSGILLNPNSSSGFERVSSSLVVRVECTGKPLLITFAPTWIENQTGTTQIIWFSPAVNNTPLMTYSPPEAWAVQGPNQSTVDSGAMTMAYTPPTPGSKVIDLRYFLPSGTQYGIGAKSQLIVRELLTPNVPNGLGP